MGGTRPKEYALIGAFGAMGIVYYAMTRTAGRWFPNGQSESLLLGLGLLAGLKHPIRRKIYDHLSLLPGDHFRSIVRSLHLAAGTARYHLDALVRDGLLYKQDTNGRARYYVSGNGAAVNRLYARHWEYRDVRLRVLVALRRLESAQAAVIAKALGISRQLVSYHLEFLEKAGRVRRQGSEYRVVSGRR